MSQAVPAEPALWARLVEQSPNPIVLVDRDYRFRQINAAGLRLRTQPDRPVIGQTIESIVGAENFARIRPHLDRCFARLRSRDCQWFTFPGRTPRFVQADYFPLAEPDQPVEFVAVQLHDITARPSPDSDAADAAIIDREQHYRLLVEAIPVPVWRCNRLGDLLDCNQRWYEYTGQTPAQARGRGWMNAVHPDDLFNVIDRLRPDATHGLIYQAEYRLRRASDGVYRWHLARAVPLRSATGHVLGWLGCAVDIDDQKHAEEALRGSETKLRALLEALPDQAMRISRAGVYLDIHTPPGFASVLDLAKRPGLHVRDVLSPDRADRLLARVESVLATGEMATMEYQVPMPDGTQRDREARIVPSGSDEVLLLARDVTERSRAERDLRDSEERYRLHFEQANDVIYSLSLDDRITDVSPSVERILGYQRDELIGRHVVECGILCPEDFEHLARDRESVLAGERPMAVYRVRGKDGAVHWCEVTGSPLVRDGQPIGGLLVARDITMRKAAEDALHKLNADLEERVSARTAALAEANRRLRALALELLLAEERERHRLAIDLHDAPVQALTLARMKLSAIMEDGGSAVTTRLEELNDFLTSAYNSLRSLTFQLSPPILYDLGLVPALEWLAGDLQNRYHLEVTIEDDGQRKPTDEPARVLLFRCVRELLINVVKHAGAREARIEVRRGGDRLLVSVEDDGVGFDPAGLSGGDPGDVRLGLFSIRERLANIGGLLTIQSGPGRGTCVTMELPIRLDSRGGPESMP